MSGRMEIDLSKYLIGGSAKTVYDKAHKKNLIDSKDYVILKFGKTFALCINVKNLRGVYDDANHNLYFIFKTDDGDLFKTYFSYSIIGLEDLKKGFKKIGRYDIILKYF